MSESVRFGILGSGAVAHGFAVGLRSVPDATLAAVASGHRENAVAFASRHGDVRVHDEYLALVEDPDIDVIYVATPNDRHAGDALLCLANDKAVLCEKPFTIDGAEARRVIDEAKSRKLFCMEGMWMRFIPAIRRVAQLVADGAVGEIRSLHADFSHAASVDPGSRLFDATRGGGALLDLGVYTLSFAQLLLGEPDELSGRLDIGSTGVDEHAAIVLGYVGGATAVLTSSLRTIGPNHVVVAGTKGTIRMPGPICAPTRFTLERVAAPSAEAGEASRLRELVRVNQHTARAAHGLVRAVRNVRSRDTQTTRLDHVGNGYNYEAAEVVRCLREGEQESPLMPLSETQRVVDLMDRLRRELTADDEATP